MTAGPNDRQVAALTLGERLDISQARDWHARLCAALDSGAPVTFEANAVQRADAAGLQLLTAFVRAARGRGLAVTWQAPSAALVHAAQLAGLANELNLPAA